ncbi:LuxR family transcriptional regulator [Dactylosporangium fulvum]|uniref:LuxR C-terminal-related transcriptional regulator n=1 Tax=Dactylosporangium fulvum TaxID=53359 RepID=A0ABY5WCQ3_9ACTN|nr:LuxR C-terminal-related transcriptional regulator [Dactylosporangium fulvum]UWP86941.1 LuxR C-terminal-related transcriptional regulator [Dactylosporangium fulvum]
MAPVGNLPVDIALFVGREEELAQAGGLLSRVRLLTLTGPGGVGKTRLALRVAARLQEAVHDGVWMIDLSGIPGPTPDTPERLYAHMALALRIQYHGPAGLDVLVDHLRTRRVLLVLDNCEHLIPATHVCVTALLRAAPYVRVLATSRQPLGVDGEHTLVVPPLPLADAIALFTAGATAAGHAGRVPTGADANAVADLCHRLDGLPLAIKLAAGRIRTLSVRQLLHRLDDRFRLLTDTTLLADSQRHSTLEGVVEWSYELCTEAEQQLWARASVFARAFDVDAAEAVCGGAGIDPLDVIDLVTGLVDKSVLTVDTTATSVHSPARYYLLDTLREYGLRKLADAGDEQRVRGRHRDYYRDLVADGASAWFAPHELESMAAVYREVPDILAAIDESVTRGDLPTARTMCRDLVRVRAPFFWGFLDLAAQQLRRVLDLSDAERVNSAEEAVNLSSAAMAEAWVVATQGNHDRTRTLLTLAHDLHRRWGLDPTGSVLFVEGGGDALLTGSYRAIALLEAARTAFSGDPATATDQHQATMMWAMAKVFADEPAAAVAASQEYLEQSEKSQAPWSISWALWTAALAALRVGDQRAATDFISRGLRLQRDMDEQWGLTWTLEAYGWIIAAGLDQADDPQGEAERAAWLLGASSARQRKLGVTLAGLRPLADRHAVARAQITAVLDELAVVAAMAAGARGHARAVRVALGEPTPRRPTASGTDNLTDREREVAVLVAEGRTSAQIGAQLRINPRTVDVHVGNIMRKLGLRRRSRIAAWIAAQPGGHD